MCMCVIILNGPAGVGKTTVAKLLAQKSKSSICIHGDSLRGMIMSRSGSEEGRLGYRNGAMLIDNFKRAGYDLVIFDYIFPSSEHVTFFLSLLRDASLVSVFTLWAEEKTVHDRRRGRNREDVRCSVVDSYRELQSNLHEFKMIIETDDRSPEQVSDDIWNRMHV